MSDDPLRLDNQLCFPLYAATRAMMQAYQPLLDALGLTYPQYLVLLVLWETDRLSVKEIGERLYLDSGTLTPLLKRLQQAGLVTRTRAKHDERIVVVALTAEGRRMKRRAAQVPQALFCKLEMPIDRFLRLRGEMKDLFLQIRDSNEKERAG